MIWGFGRALPDVHPAGTRVGGHEVPYPFAMASGRKAMAVLAGLRRANPSTTPVILGGPQDLARLCEFFHDVASGTVAGALAGAEGQSGVEVLARHAQVAREQTDVHYRKLGIEPPDTEAPERHGDWPAGAKPLSEVVSLRDPETGHVRPELYLALLPTARPWEAAGYLKFGSWNSCPPPHVHVALARDWFSRFGARPDVVTGDIIEFEVARPVSGRAVALELAQTQFAYCNDIVDQGVGTIEALAATLLDARRWFFWWD